MRFVPSQIIPAYSWVACFKHNKDEVAKIPIVCWALGTEYHEGKSVIENQIHGMIPSGGDIVSAKTSDNFIEYEVSVPEIEMEVDDNLN